MQHLLPAHVSSGYEDGYRGYHPPTRVLGYHGSTVVEFHGDSGIGGGGPNLGSLLQGAAAALGKGSGAFGPSGAAPSTRQLRDSDDSRKLPGHVPYLRPMAKSRWDIAMSGGAEGAGEKRGSARNANCHESLSFFRISVTLTSPFVHAHKHKQNTRFLLDF